MSDLLTRCVCIDPRRISPATGHYPGCPDSIIPPDQLLPPWEVVHRAERVYEGRSARSAQHPEGKPIFGVVQTTELVPGRRWTAPAHAPATMPVHAPATMPVHAPATSGAPVPASVSADPSQGTPPSIVVVLDTETTGLRKAGTVVGVCEIGLAVVDLGPLPGPGGPRIIARHSKLLHPGVPIPREASLVHGILDRDVRDCPHLADVWPALLAWVARFAGENAQVIAHNAPYDREVIADVLRAHSLDLPPWEWRCSMALARKVVPGLPSYSLHDGYGKAGLATSLSLVKGEGHRAMGDVITTVSLLGALRARAGAWTAWRGDAAVWGAAKAVEAPRGAEKPVESAAVPAAVPPVPAPAPSPSPKTVKGRRTVPTGPSLFDRLQEQGPSVAEKMHERKTAS